MDTNDNDPLGLGAWIRGKRLRTGYTPAKFGKMIGASESGINQGESGERVPTAQLIARVGYFTTLDDPIAVLEKVYTATLDKPITLARPAGQWVYRLQPIMADADPATIELILSLAQITADAAKGKAPTAKRDPLADAVLQLG